VAFQILCDIKERCPTNPLIPQIKSRLTILEAARRYAGAELEHRGNYYWCKCLTNSERTPSMRIKPDKDQYRCYSCGRYGDQIDLVAEALNIPLPDAIQLLASDLGIQGVISQEERERIERERLDRQRERKKKEEQQNIIKAEYMRLIDIEKLMYFFLSGIKDESDLERFEVIQSLKNKDLLGDWLNILINGSLEEKLKVVEISKNYKFWEE